MYQRSKVNDFCLNMRALGLPRVELHEGVGQNPRGIEKIPGMYGIWDRTCTCRLSNLPEVRISGLLYLYYCWEGGWLCCRLGV